MGLFDLVDPLVRTVRFGLPLARLRADSDRTVADALEEVARARGGHPAIVEGDRSVTYRELNEGANRVARWAQSMGLGRGDRVALLMLNRPEFVETWFGLAKVGVTTAMLNTNLTGGAIEHAVDAASATHLIVGSECLGTLATADVSGCTIHVRRDGGDDVELPEGAADLDAALADLSVARLSSDVRADSRSGDDLFVIYTSGTTGLPKAARFSHLRFFTTASAARIGGFDAGDVMYCALPLYHTAGGVMALGSALLSGGTVALRRKFSASEFWSDVRRYDVPPRSSTSASSAATCSTPRRIPTSAPTTSSSASATACAPTSGRSSRPASPSRRSSSSTGRPRATSRSST